MNTIETMRAYIDRTKIKNAENYCLKMSAIQVMYEIADLQSLCEAFELAFEYGRAKGYRMAKRELKNG